MTPERARELLGGLASGILTLEERKTLFEAALHDQALFNEVADELEFAAFLENPDTRAQLVNRIEVAPERRSWFAAKSRWLALTGALAAASVVFVAVWNRNVQVPVQQAQVESAPAPEQQPKLDDRGAPRVAGKPAPEPPAKPAVTARPPVAAAKRKESSVPASTREKDSPPPKTVAAAPPPPVPPAAPPAPQQAAPSIGMFRAANRFAPPSLLTGTVRDASGNAVPNVSIDIVDSATNSTAHTTSDATGRFVAPPLAPGGPYTVIAEAPGFKKEQRSGITIAANQPVMLDIPLQAGSVSETVEVTSAAPPVQVAVLDFLNSTPQEQSGQQAADIVSNQLLGSGQVRVVDRDTVKRAVERRAKSSATPPNAKDAAAVGREVGADKVVVGAVRQDRDRSADNVNVSAEVIDTKQARAVSKVAADGPLQGASNQVSAELASRLGPPLTGSVTRVSDGMVQVSFQGTAAARVGDRLEVYRGRRKLGDLTLTSADGRTAAGTFSGSTTPQRGDRVTSPR
jgi:TolB-like protein